MEDLISQLLFFVKGIWKYRWYAVVLSWLVALVGWGYVYRLPDDYRVTSRVYVDTESLLKPLMAGMANIPNTEQQVSIMSRTLVSRPNVEKVIRMVDLDLKASNPKDRETLVTDLMKEIRITGTGRDDIYSISYNNPNPKVAKDVVQSLLTIFVESSIGDKKNDSDKAVQFIEDQIKQYDQKLATAENALKEFKLKHAGLLPREGSNYAAQLTASQDQLNQARLDLREAEQARNAIKSQLNGTSSGGSGTAPSLNPELDERILSLQKNLDSLRLTYTDAHPDIVSTRRLITQLQQQKADEAKMVRSADPSRNYSPLMQQLNMSLSTAEAKVASMRARVDEFSSRNARLQGQLTAGPQVESELTQLNRDYTVNKENYDKLVERRESARLSGDLNATTDMIKFRVVDPPTVPLRPTGPDRPKLVSAVFAAALLAGVGFALLMSQIRPTFVSQHSLREVTGLPILGAVSMNWTPLEKTKRKRSVYVFGVAVLVLALVYAGGLTRLVLAA
ncbi:MAG: XrtA system polysaccharide chain length determinant [Janthinobacterium lividum]